MQADQLLVTGANRDGNAVYQLGIVPGTLLPITPVVSSSVTQINSAADASTHAGFGALVWVPNSVCQSLDLIAADAANGQIVRYAGATALANCNAPASSSSGTPIVNPVSQLLFKWSKIGSGPAQPTGISADANGNLFVVASSGSWDPNASVWVLPFNKTKNLYCTGAAGVYCAPVLVDEKFGGTVTQQLSEVLVAGIPAGTGGKTALWNAGDLLVLVGDSFDARLMVYAQTKLYYTSGKSQGLLNIAALPLSAPTSTPIPWSVFHAQSAVPAGMDIWPGNPIWHTNNTLLLTTADGRILEFDTLLNKVVCNFAENRGTGLQKIKVGSYASESYAFVTQLEAKNTGQILVFGAAPVSGTNNPIKTISSNMLNPQGLALISAGTSTLPAVKSGSPCVSPNPPCVVAPLGPELVSTITGGAGDHLSGTVLEQNCIVATDPRVTIGEGGWTCNGTALPIGAGTNYCPTFPAAVIPGSVCGHSGLTGAGFAVIEGTATGIDPNDNNSFITTAGNIDEVLPGPNNLECTPAFFAANKQIPLIAWGPRSDLTTVEGIIPEDSLYGPYLGGEPGYLTELTGGCDTSTTGSRELSIFAIGLGLSDPGSQGYAYTLQTQKYNALEQTVSTAAISSGVQSNLSTDIADAETYVQASEEATYPSSTFTNDINCALNGIAATDAYLRANLTAFSSNLVTTGGGGGNANPAGDIDGRLANWYTVLNTMLAGNAPYATWPIPPGNVPACNASNSNNPQITSFTANPTVDSDEPSNDKANLIATVSDALICNYVSLNAYIDSRNIGWFAPNGLNAPEYIGSSNFNFNPQYPITSESGNGTDTYTVTCYGPPGTTPAFAGPLLLSNPNLPASTLSISGFSYTLDDFGLPSGLSWQTSSSVPDSTPNPTCSIVDEFESAPQSNGGAPDPNGPSQQPTTGLPGSTPYYYYQGAAYVFCATDPPGSDTIVLSCTDPNYGTAVSSVTLTPASEYYCNE